jgi:hypothetical protein
MTLLYHPDPSKDAPLPSHGQLEIGTGKPGLEALSFALPDENYGYLKLFVSSIPVDMRMLGAMELMALGRPVLFPHPSWS